MPINIGTGSAPRCSSISGSRLADPALPDGYAATGFYLDARGLDFGAIPEEPTVADARTALATLEDVFIDFPFAEPCDRAAAIAAVLTTLARPAIDAPAPLFMIRATDAGTGKGLIAGVVGLVASGHKPTPLPPVANPDEERKRLLAILAAGDPVVLFDNYHDKIGTPALDALLTGDDFGDRVLGESRNAKFSTRATTWLATGNNLTVRGDLARRSLPIDLDARCERPDTRRGFRHDPLAEYVLSYRAELVRAGLIVLRSYQVCDADLELEPFGSFERWSRFVREPLVWLGMADPCEGRARVMREADPEREAHAVLLAAWYRTIGPERVTIADLVGRAERAPELRAALAAIDPRSDGDRFDRRRIGNMIRRFRGKVLGGLRLTDGGRVREKESDSDVRMWCVERIASPGVTGVKGVTSHQSQNHEAEEKKDGSERKPTPATPVTPAAMVTGGTAA